MKLGKHIETCPLYNSYRAIYKLKNDLVRINVTDSLYMDVVYDIWDKLNIQTRIIISYS